jgi:hypothetical protein
MLNRGWAVILGGRAEGKAGELLGGDRGARLREEGEGADARARAVSGGEGDARCGVGRAG